MSKEKLTKEQMELIFDTMEKIDSKEIKKKEGIDKLWEELGKYHYNSYQMLYTMFKCMKNGKTFTRGANYQIIEFFINKLGEKYGKEIQKKSIEATFGYIVYLYEQLGHKPKGLLEICKQIAKKDNIDISFSIRRGCIIRSF